ncbi:hypothetical protein L7F22_053689 [Adiantum nelumboides]|nr:hypothetical protein [Adiantum nelumboides]
MYTAERQVCRLRYRLLKGVIYQDVEYFDTKSKAAQIAGVMSTDINVIHSVIGFKMGKFVQYTTTFVAGTCVGLYYCWQLALLTIATVPITAVLAGIYSKAGIKIAAKAQAAINKAAIIVEETILQIRTIYSYTSESRQIKKFTDALEEKVHIGQRGGFVKGLGLGALMASVHLSWGLLLWFGGVLVTKEGIKAGNIITATFSIIYAGQALGTATECLQSFAGAKISTARVFQLINRTPSISNTDEGKKPLSVTGTIVLKNVSFKYKSRPNVKVLDDVSLEIPATKVVALVGSSGSGKSTVISLIERYYDPEKGEIFLDGISLKSLNLKWLRSQIGLVGQEPVLFATSIVKNLLYAREDATVAEIEAASNAANAHTFIKQLPHEYQTQVGEGGTQLSGGQRQRLAIARAILQNPPILLLDEATSALDTQSERLVQEALEGFMQNRTTVVVAHRLLTIRNADKIVVLRDGQIVETGSHDTLVKLGPKGAYYSLLQMQALHTNQKKKTVGTSNMNSPLRKQNDRNHYQTQNQSISFSPSMLSIPISPCLSTPIHIQAVSNEKSMEISKAMEKTGWNNHGTRKMMKSFLRTLIAAKKMELCLATLSALLSGAAMPVFLFFLYEVCIAYVNKDKSAREKEIERVLLLLGILAFFSFTLSVLQHLNLARSGEFLVKHVMDTKFRGKHLQTLQGRCFISKS